MINAKSLLLGLMSCVVWSNGVARAAAEAERHTRKHAMSFHYLIENLPSLQEKHLLLDAVLCAIEGEVSDEYWVNKLAQEYLEEVKVNQLTPNPPHIVVRHALRNARGDYFLMVGTFYDGGAGCVQDH